MHSTAYFDRRALRRVVASLVILVVALPLLAMQFTREVQWQPGDFAIATLLLLGAGAGLELVVTSRLHKRHRIVLVGLVGVLFLAIWAEGAIGLL